MRTAIVPEAVMENRNMGGGHGGPDGRGPDGRGGPGGEGRDP